MEEKHQSDQELTISCLSAITVHLFPPILSNQHRNPHLLKDFFFSNLSYEVAKKIENLFLF